MATRTVELRTDVLERLERLQRGDEDLNDVLDRLLARSDDPLAYAGVAPGIGTHAEAAREEVEDDLAERTDEP